jgi:hypothetical protein
MLDFALSDRYVHIVELTRANAAILQCLREAFPGDPPALLN